MTTLEELSKTYTILEVLGAGSGGVVYKAYHKRLQQEVVLKKINSNIKGKINQRKEVDILKNLHHTFLPQVLDFLEVEGDVFTVMNYVPGKSFQQLLSENVKFNQKDVIRWSLQLCSALNYLHQQTPPIIHSDIKPANIMLTPDGNICLIDFNISLFMDDTTILGYTGGYSSPEQYAMAMDSRQHSNRRIHVKLDVKSDIYSLGATLYHILTGQKLKDYQEVINPQFLEQFVSKAFAQVLIKATQLEPSRRYANVYQMFQAIQSIDKQDSRYLHLVWMQRISTVVLCIFFLGSTTLFLNGVRVYQQEKNKKYEEIVGKQIAATKAGQYQEEQKQYEQAVKLISRNLESYEEHARALNEQGAYVDCVNYILTHIESNSDFKEEELENVYAIKANCFLELEDYDNAVKTYEQALEINSDNVNVYKDYAISLAYNGNQEKAETVLKEAMDKGLENSFIHYTKGEIEYSLGKYEVAYQEFSDCIDTVKDDYVRMRAYIMASKSKEAIGDQGGNRKVLQEAIQALPQERQMILLERLIQLDIDLADKSSDNEYRWEAIDCLKKVIACDWADSNTYDILILQYEKTGDLNAAIETTKQMEEIYGETYQVYKRYAFIELDQQNLLDNSNRDYSTFLQYYEEAENMYQNQEQKNKDTDEEMLLLESAYQQVKAGGWL